MNTKLLYSFHKDIFGFEETVYLEFDNPPFIPENKICPPIDWHSFFSDEIADKIEITLENDRHLRPYKTQETWNKKGYFINYEFMNPNK